MNAWVVRGLGMALAHFVARLLLALAVAQWPTNGSAFRTLTIIVVILIAVIWGGVDGINDRRRNPDPDDAADLTMVWLKASVVAGLLAGLVSWLFSAIASIAVSTNTVFFELTSGAAFTVLLVFIPSTIAVAVGRFLAGRDSKKNGNTNDGDSTRDSRRRARDDDRQLVPSGSGASAGAAAGAGTAGYAASEWRDQGQGQQYSSDQEYAPEQEYASDQSPDDYYGDQSIADTEHIGDDRGAAEQTDADTEVFEPVQQETNRDDWATPDDRRATWQEPER